MTRHCSITKKASHWLSIECHVFDCESFLRLYMRCEVVNGSPDLSVYRRGTMNLFEYSFEVSRFLNQVQLLLAKDDYEKKSAEFELSFEF